MHSPRVNWRLLAAAVLLAAATLSCSLGEILVGPSARGVVTPTKTPRPTYTPLAGARTSTPTPGPLVRGDLPPGVTVMPTVQVAPAVQSSGESPAGSTSLIIYATNTPGATATPGPTGTPRPTATPDDFGPLPVPEASSTPYVIVSAELITGRRGPGTTFPAIGSAEIGTTLMILGRTPDSSWWQVCCLANQPVWVSAAQVTARGALSSAPVFTPQPTLVPTATPPRPGPTAVPATAAPPLPPFDIAQGPFFPIPRDNGILTIWVKVYEGPSDNMKPLPGYMLKVSRDGVDVSSAVQSHGTAFDNTKPEGAMDYNLKFELNNAGEADWRITLTRSDGTPVSPARQFTTKGDSYRNLVVYVAYWLAR